MEKVYDCMNMSRNAHHLPDVHDTSAWRVQSYRHMVAATASEGCVFYYSMALRLQSRCEASHQPTTD